jgi:hypothetical protein
MAIVPCSDPKQIMQVDPIDVMLSQFGKTKDDDLTGIYEPDPEDEMAIGITRPRPVFDPAKVTNKELAEDVLWQYRKVRKRMKGLAWTIEALMGPSDKLRAMHSARKKSQAVEARKKARAEAYSSLISSSAAPDSNGADISPAATPTIGPTPTSSTSAESSGSPTMATSV